MVIEAGPEAAVFALKAALLSEGRTDTMLARTDLLTTRIKVYAEGGENAMHTHVHEDHVFVVLAGQATFHLNHEGNAVVVNKHEGVLLPRGAFYRFQSSGDENLVLLRVGAAASGPAKERIGPNGQPLAGKSDENKHVPGVPIAGKFFGA